MNNEMTFGKCLKFLLTTLNAPMSQLAKAINVDNSLVNHWVHERRVPSGIYINDITEFLSAKLIDSIHIKMIEELFYNLKGNKNSSEISNKEKLYIILQTSLINSQSSRNAKKASREAKEEPMITNSINLSSNDKLIYGMTNIYKAVISISNPRLNLNQMKAM